MIISLGSLYDYYLCQTGGYYGVKSVFNNKDNTEQSIYTLLNPTTLEISVINRKSFRFDDIHIIATIVTFNNKQLFHKEYMVIY